MDYKSAGVDTEKAQGLISGLKDAITQTYQNAPGEVVGSFGGFAGIFNPSARLHDHNIVACTDGVGTKLHLLQKFNKLPNAGFDLVAMCVNDLYCSGATPLFFLDYISCGKLEDSWYDPVIRSIATACQQANMALLGGETAEHPGVMKENEFDLAGFCVGLQPKDRVLPDSGSIQAGDVLLALPSSGPHSNGFSLIRKILSTLEANDEGKYKDVIGGLLDDLLAPTRIYSEVSRVYNDVKGLVHITGGGFYENLPRVLPQGLGVVIDGHSDFNQPVFDFFREFVAERDLFATFNMGVGMVLICEQEAASRVSGKLQGCRRLGVVEKSTHSVVIQGIDT